MSVILQILRSATQQALQILPPAFLLTAGLLALFRRLGLTQFIGRKTAASLAFPLAVGLWWTPLGPTGLSLHGLLQSFCPVLSISALALSLDVYAVALTGRSLLEARGRLAFASWLAGLSVLLWLASLGLIPYDLYACGYHFTWWLALPVTAAVAACLWGRWPLALFALGTLAAYDLRLLASANLFDYLTDGVTGCFALGCLSWRALRGLRRITPTTAQPVTAKSA